MPPATMIDPVPTTTETRAEPLPGLDALCAEVEARADEIEAGRRLPLDLVRRMAEVGVFRLFVPATHGGLESTLVDSLDVIEALGRADGSVGWATMIGCETPHVLAKLSRETFDRLYANGPDVSVAGAFAALGKAARVEGGWRVSGRWPVVSGCQHSDWVFGTCLVEGAPPPAPGAPPAMVSTLLRPGQLEVLDTWRALGLRGTGSHDIVADGAFVPDELAFDLFGGAPSLSGPAFVVPVFQFSCQMAAVAVGIAAGALAEITAQVKAGRHRSYTRASLADSPVFHHTLGEADAGLRAARAGLREAAAALWAAAGEGPEAVLARSQPVASTVAWVTERCARVVDACYRAGGTRAVRDGSPLQRRFRDMHTVTQHTVTSDGWYGAAGATLLGKRDEIYML